MQKFIIIICSISSMIFLQGCGNTDVPPELNDETPTYTTETFEDTATPTVYTEIPTTTDEEIITQEDSSF